jgi:hypothetical protein
MLMNREKKKKRSGRYFRLALLIVILLILLVLLFGEQWGIGQGDLLRLVNMQESPAGNVETPEEVQEETSGYGEVKVRVAGNTIQVDETAYTLDGFEGYLDTLDENTLIVLMDEEANYTLFTTVEEMIDAKAVPYVIEE